MRSRSHVITIAGAATRTGRCFLLLTALGLAACGGRSGNDDADTGGFVTGADMPEPLASIDYEVTSERLQGWLHTQRTLDTIPDLPPPPRLDAVRLTQSDVSRGGRIPRA